MKVKIFYFFIMFFSVISAKASGLITLKELDTLNQNVVFSSYININNGKMKSNQNAESLYFTRFTYYFVKSRIAIDTRKLRTQNKEFLSSWLRAKYEQNITVANNNLTFYLFDSQVDLFYSEVNLLEDGKTYNLIIQNNVFEKLKKENLLNTDLVFEVAFLGFVNDKNIVGTRNYFLITNYTKKNIQNNENQTLESNYSDAKSAIQLERYDYAITKLKEYITKFPNNMEARKDLCLSQYLKYLKTPSPILGKDTIKCYESIGIMYEKAEIYYSIASLYHQELSIETNTRITEILKNLNKSIDLLYRKSNLSGEEKIVLFNSLYLRGIFKLSINDKSGLDDLSLVESERPDLVNINLYTND